MLGFQLGSHQLGMGSDLYKRVWPTYWQGMQWTGRHVIFAHNLFDPDTHGNLGVWNMMSTGLRSVRSMQLLQQTLGNAICNFGSVF